MKPKAFLLAALFAAVSIPGISMAAEVSTEPVGVLNLSMRGSSDTRVSAPLRRPSVLQAAVSGVSGNVVTVSASLTTNQFVYSGVSQPDHFYVQVKSTLNANSPVAGTWFSITANSAASGSPATSTLTLDPGGSQTIQGRGLVVGDVVQVIPFWTLDSMFPAGKGVTPTSDIDRPKDTVGFAPQDVAGANLQVINVSFYNTSADLPTGWYNLGTFQSTGNLPIPPDSYLVLRNTGAARSVAVTGGVATTKQSTVIGIISAGVPQDNFVSNPFPVAISLNESKLFQSGAFKATSNIDAPQDLVLAYDGTEVGYNVQPSKTYFYSTDPQLGTGWYRLGTFAGPLDNEKVLMPGLGFIVRKVAGPVQSYVWTLDPPY